MSTRYDMSNEQERQDGLRHAVDAVRRGELVVMATDTVYGVGVDAFSPQAVADLLAAKGRGRSMPPPVLVSDHRTLDGLAVDVPVEVRALVDRFWPGPLTVVCWAQPTLCWDLGDTEGTVALRVPDHPDAIALLSATGPMAVSSANLSGQPAAICADEAEEQLGDAVAAVLDSGPAPGEKASTVVDATGPTLRVLREGALSLAQLREVVPNILAVGQDLPEIAAEPEAGTEPGAASA